MFVNAIAVRRLVYVGMIIISTSAVFAQGPFVTESDWASAMIDKDQWYINYKSVAKGQDVSFKIRVRNIYKEEMHVTGLTTSCGCISWDENRNGVLNAPIVIPSGKETTLTLRLDTIRHHGEQKNKKGTITIVNAASGLAGHATILAEGYIRTDVVLQPGSVNFGSVDPQKGAEQRILLNYAGRSDWKLVRAGCQSPFLNVQIEEKSRGNGLVNYELIVQMRQNAPVGYLRDQMVLVTDDLNNPQIPVHVEGRIEPDIVVTDANFGTLTAGKPKKIQVLVRYTRLPVKAFKIEKFERTRDENTIKVEKSSELKPLHQLSLTFTPPNEPGPYEEDFYLTISDRTEPIVFKARGSIQAAPLQPVP